MQEVTMAQEYVELAQMDERDFGYVQKSTSHKADVAAAYGSKTPTGYILFFSDGSSLDWNIFTNEMVLA